MLPGRQALRLCVSASPGTGRIWTGMVTVSDVSRIGADEPGLWPLMLRALLLDQRIAGSKIEQIKERLANLKRAEDQPRDSRIYPGMFAPVMIWDGRRVIKPMR